MSAQPNPYKGLLKIRNYTIFGVFVWTIFIAILLIWNINLIRDEALHRAYIYTKVGFDKDVLYRRWVAEHGGVYVKVDSITPPNPYLSHIPDRDIAIDSNVQLTLMNPAYMTRQVYELQEASSEVRGHITSLNPIRLENAPDVWEEKVLKEFEKGLLRFGEIDTIEGKQYFRFMRPFIVEKSCLKCHAQQGYKINDIRGGISTSYPMDQIYVLISSDIRNQYFLYGLIWILGLVIFVTAYRHSKKSDNKRLAAEDALLVLNSQLEEKVKERTEELQQEVVERKKVNEKIKESQSRFETLFNFGVDAVFVHPFSEKGFEDFIEVNRIACDMFGYTKKEFLKLNPSNITNRSDAEYVGAEENRKKLSQAKSLVFEAKMIKKSGEIFPVEISSTVFDYLQQKSIMSVVRDITERKQAEEELRIEKEFSETIIETSTAIIIGLDKNHLIRIFSKGAERVTGYVRSEVMGKDWFELFLSVDKLDEMNKVWEKAWGTPAHSYINPILVKTGEERMISWQNSGIYVGEDSAKHLLISIGEDITERKQAEIELEESKAYIQTIYDSTSDAIFIHDSETGIILDVNQQMCDMFGYEKREVLEQGVQSISMGHSPYSEKEALQWLHKSRTEGKQTFPWQSRHKDGHLFWTEVSIISIQIGGSPRFIASVRNIDDRKKVEEELKKYREHLEELVKERTQELENKNRTLERTNKTFVGRELRMKELKEEIEKLRNG